MPRKSSNTGDYKVLDEKNMPDWVSDPEYVDDKTLQNYKHLKGTQYAMSKRHPGVEWGDAELKEWIVEQRRSQIVMTINSNMEKLAVEDTNDQQVQGIIDQYLKRFADPSPNDMVSLKEMARIQLLLDMLNDRIKHLVGNNEAIRAKDFETLTKVKRDALTAFQQLEKALGIDRTGREKETDVVNMFAEVQIQSREILARRSRPIVCHFCEQDAVDINYGLILFHMDGQVPFEFKFICPRCKKLNELYRTEGGLTEMDVAVPEQIEQEAKSGWFKTAVTVVENEP